MRASHTLFVRMKLLRTYLLELSNVYPSILGAKPFDILLNTIVIATIDYLSLVAFANQVK